MDLVGSYVQVPATGETWDPEASNDIVTKSYLRPQPLEGSILVWVFFPLTGFCPDQPERRTG